MFRDREPRGSLPRELRKPLESISPADQLKLEAISLAQHTSLLTNIAGELGLNPKQFGYFNLHLGRYWLLKTTQETNYLLERPETETLARIPILGRGVKKARRGYDTAQEAAKKLEEMAEKQKPHLTDGWGEVPDQTRALMHGLGLQETPSPLSAGAIQNAANLVSNALMSEFTTDEELVELVRPILEDIKRREFKK